MRACLQDSFPSASCGEGGDEILLVVHACDPARGSGRTPSVQVCGVESASSASVSVPGTFRLFQNFSPVENFSHFSSTQPQEGI